MRMGRSKRRLPDSLTQHLSDPKIVAFRPRTNQCRANLRTEAAERFYLARNPHRRRAGWWLLAAPLVAALEAAGVIFIEENGEGPGVRLRKTANDGEADRRSGKESAANLKSA